MDTRKDDDEKGVHARRARPLGRTGLVASPIGFGAGALGDGALDEHAARALVDEVRAMGVALVDTARSYGESEARLGRALAGDTTTCVATKVGYGVPDVPDWTYDAVWRGVDRARALLGRDVLDIVSLHSCPRDVLLRGDVVRALDDARHAGKIRVAGYAGDGDALAFAIDTGVFGLVLASYSVVDQANAPLLARAKERGLAVVVKRALGNMAFLPGAADGGPDRAELARRFAALALDLGDDPLETLVRFAAHAPFVDVTLVGTRQSARVADALAAFARGPLDDALRMHIEARFLEMGHGWDAVV